MGKTTAPSPRKPREIAVFNAPGDPPKSAQIPIFGIVTPQIQNFCGGCIIWLSQATRGTRKLRGFRYRALCPKTRSLTIAYLRIFPRPKWERSKALAYLVGTARLRYRFGLACEKRVTLCRVTGSDNPLHRFCGYTMG